MHVFLLRDTGSAVLYNLEPRFAADAFYMQLFSSHCYVIGIYIYIFQVGDDVFGKFCHKYPSDWIELQRNFERKKRQFSLRSEEIDINFPPNLTTLFAKATSVQLSVILKDPEYKKDVKLIDHYLILKPERMRMFFKEAVGKINDHIKQLLDKEQLSTVSSIILVGGFSESPIISEGIRNCFQDKRVIAPAGASSAILKGAVMYGIDTNIISSRISPYSYGVHTRAIYNPKIHPADRKRQIGNKLVVDNAFDKYVEVGETIHVGESSKVKKYMVFNPKNRDVYWNIYRSMLKEPGVCDEKFCTKIGKLTITIPDNVQVEKLLLEVSMVCRGTELDVIAKSVKPLVECKAIFDFLGTEENTYVVVETVE